MGVTIHFEGKLKSNKDYGQILESAKSFAETNGMDYDLIEESEKTLQRVRNEKDWDYGGLTKGIRIQPEPSSDPLNLEFDADNFIQEYCKTQFAEIKTHIKIIDFLKKIEPLFENLIVNDEGEYWETNDPEILQEHIDNCFEVIENAKAENQNLSGPYRMEDGRIVDLMEAE